MKHQHVPHPPYLQNRELSWLTFNERVLDQGTDPTVPLLDRLTFVSIFSSNLQEFFMVRVGSLTDLALICPEVRDNKSNMTPGEQIEAIHERCHELYPIQESLFEDLRARLAREGVRHVEAGELTDEQIEYLRDYFHENVSHLISPQIVNSRHPFPHLGNGRPYVLVRLTDRGEDAAERKRHKAMGAEGVTLGIVPTPRSCERIVRLPGAGFQFILLENVIELFCPEIFSMYDTKHTNIVCVTRNADLSDAEGTDETDDDYREHMRSILRKRARLAPVRLESARKLSPTLRDFLLPRLGLTEPQAYVTKVPLDMGYAWSLGSLVDDATRAKLVGKPQQPQWPASLERGRSLIDQVSEHEVLLHYPYESMDAFVQLLREAAHDPSVVSIKITLYRLASRSHLAEALIAAAEAGKEVTALFELRARFDEKNNIEWSQRFEEAGCRVIYGFRDYKVHSKICCITRQTEDGVQYITQLGTGNYNEKTARLYTDFSFITTNDGIGRDAVRFFRNMALETVSDDYEVIQVAPLQIKPMICERIDDEIARAREGKPAQVVFKTNSITDKEVIEKIVEASQAGVKVYLIVRGISCIVPGIPGYTDNVRIISIVGRLLEHSRIYAFGIGDDMRIYLSSADLMTRNMDKRIEIAWPLYNVALRQIVRDFIDISFRDEAKSRELLPDCSYTPLASRALDDALGEREGDDAARKLFNSQDYLTELAVRARTKAAEGEAAREANRIFPTAEERISHYAQRPVVEQAARTAADDAAAAGKSDHQVKGTAAATGTPTAAGAAAAAEPAPAPKPAGDAPATTGKSGRTDAHGNLLGAEPGDDLPPESPDAPVTDPDLPASSVEPKSDETPVRIEIEGADGNEGWFKRLLRRIGGR